MWRYRKGFKFSRLMSYMNLLSKLFNHDHSVNILCIGDIMLDCYLYGKVERISPEAPVPVLQVQSEQFMLGGAGNVVRNIASLGGHVDFVAVVGDDKPGHDIDSLCSSTKNLSYELIVMKDYTTVVKKRVISDRQQIVRIDRGDKCIVSASIRKRIIGIVAHKIINTDIVVLSDYAKGILTKELNTEIINIAKKHNVPVIVDPKSTDYSTYYGADFITPNLKELADVSGEPIDSQENIIKIASKLKANYNLSGLLVTKSQDGMTLLGTDDKFHHISTKAIEVYDVSGAGDTVVAAFSLGLASGLSELEAAQFANLCAGIVVGKLGTAVVDKNDIKEYNVRVHI